MNRRSVLAALAAGTATLAGCFGDSNDDGDDGDGLTPEPTPTPTPTPTPERTVDVTVGAVTVVPEVVALNSPDSIGTFGNRGQQYLLTEVTADSSELAPEDLQLVAGGERYAPREDVGAGTAPHTLFPYGDLYFQTEGESGWVVFEVPKPLDATTARLSWPGGEFPLGDPIVETLGRPPTSFDVTVEAPDQVEAGSPATLSVTVENTGDAPGTFVGALNRIGPSVAYTPVTAAELSLEAGGSDTWEHSYEPEPGDAGSSFEFSFVWRDGDERRSIEIVEPSDDEDSGDSGDSEGNSTSDSDAE